jgi:hypothetical protein
MSGYADANPNRGVDMTSETFSFGDDWYQPTHVVGDPACRNCWTKPLEAHDCETSGCLLHTHFGDESADCEYWLWQMGDLCRKGPHNAI